MEKKIREKKIQEYLKQLINNKIDRQQNSLQKETKKCKRDANKTKENQKRHVGKVTPNPFITSQDNKEVDHHTMILLLKTR